VLRKFHRDSADNATLANSGFGCEWAERGTRLVFQEEDEPEEENIPAFLNLQALEDVALGVLAIELCGLNLALDDMARLEG
jgi:hypothetical protein